MLWLVIKLNREVLLSLFYPEYIEYLESLLNKKDKALRFYGDGINNVYNDDIACDDCSAKGCYRSNVCKDNGEKARKALAEND